MARRNFFTPCSNLLGVLYRWSCRRLRRVFVDHVTAVVAAAAVVSDAYDVNGGGDGGGYDSGHSPARGPGGYDSRRCPARGGRGRL